MSVFYSKRNYILEKGCRAIYLLRGCLYARYGVFTIYRYGHVRLEIEIEKDRQEHSGTGAGKLYGYKLKILHVSYTAHCCIVTGILRLR
jgi:hypothetical protein